MFFECPGNTMDREMMARSERIARQTIVTIPLFIIIVASTTPAFAQTIQAHTGSLALSRFLGMIHTTLIYGVFYSLLALGFALIFGAARVVNLYHGTFYMLGAYLFATFSKTSQFSFPPIAYWILQIIIIAFVIYYVIRATGEKRVHKICIPKKISLPVGILLVAQLALLLLFFRVKLPITWHFNLFVGLVISMIFIAVLSIYINRYIIDPVRPRGVAVLIITVALAFFTERLLVAIYGESAIAVPSFVRTRAIGLIFGTAIDSKRLIMFFVGIVLIVLVWLLMNKTKIGKGVLAVAQDREAASLMGVNPNFVFSFAICVSAILAGLAGVFTAPFLGDAQPEIWLNPLIKAFAIVILGGLGSIFGSVLASFILAFFEKLTKYYVSSRLEEMVFLIVIIAILILRPQGLFGKKGQF
jgi:branched-chain amino acid transport system permease protein